MKTLVIIETTTSGAGSKIIKSGIQHGYKVIFLCSNLDRYTNLGLEQLSNFEIIITDTSSFEQIISTINIKNLKENLSGIISLSDSYVEIASKVAEYFNLTSSNSESLEIIRDKGKVRELFRDYEFSVKNKVIYDVKDLEEWKTFPAVSKSVSGTGSIDVKVSLYKDDLYKETKKMLVKYGELLIEKYETGNLISHELLVQDGKVLSLGFTNRILGQIPYFVEVSYSFPYSLDFQEKQKMEQYSDIIISLLGYRNGALHIEYILTENGPKLIEINGRLGGGMLGPMISKSFEIDIYDYIINIFCSEEKAELEHFVPKKAYSTTVIYSQKEGELLYKDDSLVHTYPNIEEFYFNAKIGDYLKEPTNFRGDLGYIMSFGKDTEEAYLKSQSALSTLIMRIKD
ncbi:ATP-grasp domain-containing protein [Streptococcus constellatus]|nr:ATP-grasp domain-containing protein [Streptococcus constellatus]